MLRRGRWRLFGGSVGMPTHSRAYNLEKIDPFRHKHGLHKAYARCVWHIPFWTIISVVVGLVRLLSLLTIGMNRPSGPRSASALSPRAPRDGLRRTGGGAAMTRSHL